MSIDKTYIDYETYKKEVAEVERLKQDLNIMLEQEEKRQGFTDAVMDENNKLNIENNQLREALRMCSPYGFIPWATSYENRCTLCKFCRVPEGNGHTDDCEYIRLTEGRE